MKENSSVVMKFGGSTLLSVESFRKIAGIVIESKNSYDHVAVVVSAMKGMTDQLDAIARKISKNPAKREYDMLISVGERISTTLLAMAIKERGHDAVSLTGSQSGIITTTSHTNAKIVNIQTQRLFDLLRKNKIAIVAGFQGVSLEKEITTLGKGGSDISAVALAIALKEISVVDKVIFFKDVDGFFEEDPKKNSSATMIKNLSYKESIAIVKKSSKELLNLRSITLAKKNNLTLQVTSIKNYIENSSDAGSFISSK